MTNQMRQWNTVGMPPGGTGGAGGSSMAAAAQPNSGDDGEGTDPLYGPPPTAGYIQALRRDLYQRDLLRNQIVDRLESLRYHRDDSDPDIPDAYKKTTIKVRTPILGDTVDRYVAALTINPWRTRLENDKDSPNAARTDGRLEKMMDRAFEAMDRQARRAVRRLMVDQLVASGRTVVKLAHVADWFKSYPQAETTYGKNPSELDEEELEELSGKQDEYARSAPWPFFWTDINVMTYHELDGGNGSAAECLVISRVAKFTLMRRYNLAPDADGKLQRADGIGLGFREPYRYAFEETRPAPGMTTTSEFIEHWSVDEPDEDTGQVTGGWVTYLVDGIVVEQKRHVYPRLPFFQILGINTASRDPRFESLSAVYHLAGMSQYVDSLLTVLSNAAYWTGFPTYQEVPDAQLLALDSMGGEDPNDPLARQQTTFEPGKMLRPKFGRIEPVQPAQLSPILQTALQQAENHLSQVGMSPAMKGNVGADASGYLANQLITSATLSLNPLMQNLSYGVSEMVEFMFRVVERLLPTQKLYLGDAYLSAADTKKYGPHNISVDIKPKIPTNEIARGTYGIQGVQNGVISQKRNRETFWDIDDPVSEDDQITVEKAMQDPRVLDAKMKIALFDPQYGVRDLLVKGATAEANFNALVQQLQQQGMPPPPGGVPPDPNAPPPPPPGAPGSDQGSTPGGPSIPGINMPSSPPPPEPPRGPTGLRAQGGGQPQQQPQRGFPLTSGPGGP